MNFSYSSSKFFASKNILKGGWTPKSFGMFKCRSNLMSKYFMANYSNKVHSISIIKPINKEFASSLLQINANGMNLYKDGQTEVISLNLNSSIKDYILLFGLNPLTSLFNLKMINLTPMHIDGNVIL